MKQYMSFNYKITCINQRNIGVNKPPRCLKNKIKQPPSQQEHPLMKISMLVKNFIPVLLGLIHLWKVFFFLKRQIFCLKNCLFILLVRLIKSRVLRLKILSRSILQLRFRGNLVSSLPKRSYLETKCVCQGCQGLVRHWNRRW